MENKRTELSVSTDVVEKMAEIAAMEVEGVVSISKKAIDLKGMVRTKTAFKGVKVENVNGAIEINVFICVANNINVKEVAEKVQQNIKEKVQNMTGSAVTQVNVNISDIQISAETAE